MLLWTGGLSLATGRLPLQGFAFLSSCQVSRVELVLLYLPAAALQGTMLWMELLPQFVLGLLRRSALRACGLILHLFLVPAAMRGPLDAHPPLCWGWFSGLGGVNAIAAPHERGEPAQPPFTHPRDRPDGCLKATLAHKTVLGRTEWPPNLLGPLSMCIWIAVLST